MFIMHYVVSLDNKEWTSEDLEFLRSIKEFKSSHSIKLHPKTYLKHFI